MQKVVQAGNTVVLDGKNLHIRNTRDGLVIKLDANNGVYTIDMWICRDETGLVFSWQGQRVVKPLSTSLSGLQHCAELEQQGKKKSERCEERELNRSGEERDDMSDE